MDRASSGPRCDGKHEKKVSCSSCSGKGKVTRSNDGSVEEVNCVVCNGTGKVP